MDVMLEKGFSKLHIKEKDGSEIHLETPAAGHHVVSMPAHHAHTHSAMPSSSPKEQSAPDTGKAITSPMVGTFYSSPSPEDPAFVKVGDTVTADTVVCIVEAMKVMNEVKAGISGKVTEILVENGHPVEYGTKLFRVE